MNNTVHYYSLVDVFAGAGGLTRGFYLTGRFKPVAAVESDGDAARTYKENFGISPLGQVETLSPEDIPRHVAVLIGGPPCQDFTQLSTVRKEASRERNHLLWHWYIRLVRRVLPDVFLIENVPHLLTDPEYAEQRRDLNVKLRNYTIVSGILNAAAFGVPQNRQRAFILGIRKKRFPGVVPHLPFPSLSVTTVWEQIGRLEGKPGQMGKDKAVLSGDDLHLGRTATTLSRLRYRYVLPGGNRQHLPKPITIKTWAENDSGHGDGFGRLRPDFPACTIRCEAFKPEKGRYLHPYKDRPLTLAEMAQLQTFDNHKFYGSYTSIAKQIGNAVPPKLAKALAVTILNLLEGQVVARGADSVPKQVLSIKDPKRRVLALLKSRLGEPVLWHLIEEVAREGERPADWGSLLLRLQEEGYKISCDVAHGAYTLQSKTRCPREETPAARRLIHLVKLRRGFRCDICLIAKTDNELHVRFIHPLAESGLIVEDNVELRCSECVSKESDNHTPGEKLLIAWLRGYGRDGRVAKAIGKIVGVTVGTLSEESAEGLQGPPDFSRCFLCQTEHNEMTAEMIRTRGPNSFENTWVLCTGCRQGLETEMIKIPWQGDPKGKVVKLLDRFSDDEFLTPLEAIQRNWLLVHCKDKLIAQRVRDTLLECFGTSTS